MKIILDDKYFIEDGWGTSVQLKEDTGRVSTNSKTKEETKVIKVIGDYSEVEQALSKYVKVKVRESAEGDMTLPQYIEHLRAVTESLDFPKPYTISKIKM